MDKYIYIYETTNLVNGHKYIGQHTSSEFDPNYKGSGKLLWQAIHKYGWDNFKARMLCPCFSQEELDDEEIMAIAHYNAVESPDYYNLAIGGQSGNLKGSKLSESTKLRMSRSHKGKMTGAENPMYGKHHSAKTRAKASAALRGLLAGSRNPRYGYKMTEAEKAHLSEVTSGSNNPFYGKKHTEESRAKMTQAKLGSNNPGANKIWITKDNKNKRVHPSELDVYIKEGWKKGRYVTDETRRKCSERNLKRYHPELFR